MQRLARAQVAREQTVVKLAKQHLPQAPGGWNHQTIALVCDSVQQLQLADPADRKTRLACGCLISQSTHLGVSLSCLPAVDPG